MDERDSDPLEPIAPVGRAKSPKPKRTPLFYQSRLIFGLSVLAAALALIASGWMFAGFAENDSGLLHLFFAFCLCFGVGALAYIPALLLAALARRVNRKDPRKIYALLICCLTLPWAVIFILAWPLGGLWMWGAAAGLAYVGLCWFWAAVIFHAARVTKA